MKLQTTFASELIALLLLLVATKPNPVKYLKTKFTSFSP